MAGLLLLLFMAGECWGFLLPVPALSATMVGRRLPKSRHLSFVRPAVAGNEAGAVVGEVLELINGTDRGADAEALPLARRKLLYEKLDSLEGRSREEDYVRTDRALGDYEVTFVGEKRATNQVNQTVSSQAGGYWRGRLGRSIFETTGLYQNLLRMPRDKIPGYVQDGLRQSVTRKQNERNPNINSGIGIRSSYDLQETEIVAVNLVCAKFLQILSISVVLVGIVTELKEEQRVAIRKRAVETGRAQRLGSDWQGDEDHPPPTQNTVRVDFSSPLIAVGPAPLQRFLKLSIGPATDVFLDTTYVDDKIRLGRGATSGSRFVFQRVGDESPQANLWRSLVASPSPLPAKKIGLVIFGLVAVKLLATVLLLLAPSAPSSAVSTALASLAIPLKPLACPFQRKSPAVERFEGGKGQEGNEEQEPGRRAAMAEFFTPAQDTTW
eukprot:750443-Hanusia_phi.AAC.6